MTELVFAVEATSVQLAWRRLPRPEVTFEIDGRRFDVDARGPAWYRDRRPLSGGRGGPGALVVDGLEPATRYDIVLHAPGRPAERVASARTAAPPPGRVLARFATVGDCHIGERRFGPARALGDPTPLPDGMAPYPVRALRAALEESREWGAETVIAKGDLTHVARASEAETVAEVLGAAPMPVHAILSNHDVRSGADVATILSRGGVDAGPEARAVDLPGVRVVLGHSPVRGLHAGRIESSHLEEMAELAAGAAGPVVVVLHHPPGRGRLPRYYPPAIGWPDSRALVRRLAEANPAAVLLAGHTHRNRWYRAGPLPVAEVGSTKDYPGQWAGYTVYEGGIAQVARRIAAPDVIAWTEMTARALGGLWGWWSPGSLADRCWSYTWPATSGPPEP
ncbi:MAG: metallophosphoesterase family protein [Acidimicrobiales bacterium]|nr:metallophosphoesterase family protein [Acidimicrobiales bacterium]